MSAPDVESGEGKTALSATTRAVIWGSGLCYALQAVGAHGVTLAMPQIVAEFGGDESDIAWLNNGYLLGIVLALIPMGALADAMGPRFSFTIGASLFTVTNLVAAIAPSMMFLIACRLLQGIAAAGIITAGLLAVTELVRVQQDRTRAVARWSAIGAIGMAAGTAFGGFLSDAHWQVLFVVIGAATAVAAVPVVRSGARDAMASSFAARDRISLSVFAFAMACLTGFVTEFLPNGWTLPICPALLVLALLGLAGVVVVEARGGTSRILARLAAVRSIRQAWVCGGSVNATYATIPIVFTFVFVSDLGFSESLAGLLLLPLTVPAIPGRAIAGRYIAKHGTLWALRVGLFIMVPALALLLLGGILPSPLALVALSLLVMCLLAAGASLIVPAVSSISVDDAPTGTAGASSGVSSMARQMAQVVSTAIALSLLATFGGAGNDVPAVGLLFVVIACVALGSVIRGDRTCRASTAP